MNIERRTSEAVSEPSSNLWSNCLQAGPFVFLSGLTAAAEDGTVVGDDATSQSREVMRKVRALVEACGGSIDDVVKLVIYMTDIDDKAAFSTVRREVFAKEDKPCSTLVEVSRLVDPRLVVEVDATAVLADADG